MGIREALRIALANIRANKLRAFFTVLGTVVGVTFLIAVITLLKGMDAYMKEEFAGRLFGQNTVLVRRIPELDGPSTEETWREWQRPSSISPRQTVRSDATKRSSRRFQRAGRTSRTRTSRRPICAPRPPLTAGPRSGRPAGG